jgi:hypothetical protein
MRPPRTTIRSIVACMLACGLLATMTSTAAAMPLDARGDAPTSSLAGTTSDTPRQDLRSPDARDAADTERIARTMEQYYQSFDKPVPEAPFATAAPASTPEDSPFLVISVIAGGLALVLAGTALVVRHRRTPAV